jgi:hypothetical protein
MARAQDNEGNFLVRDKTVEQTGAADFPDLCRSARLLHYGLAHHGVQCIATEP